MSTALAVAGVTAVLRGLIESWLADQDANAALGGASANVTAVAPDTIELTGANAGPRLNLFMHQASQNPGWRNIEQPSRDDRGRRTASPPLALDLHYILTAYGPEELQAEVLLGYGMQFLHEVPFLDRAEIEDQLPPELAGSQLGRQVELIKVTPEPMSTEELSKLWSALQAHYRPTAAYHVSVVLIESTAPGRSAKPVLTRGPVNPATGREQGVAMQIGTRRAVPTITLVRLPSGQPAAALGNTVTLEGQNLGGTDRGAHLVNPQHDVDRVIAAIAGGDSDTIGFVVPNQPANFPVATYAVRALVQRPGETSRRESNRLSLIVMPRITTALPLTVTRDAGGTATLTLSIRPRVRPYQRAALILGTREVLAQPFSSTTGSLTFVIPDAEAGNHQVRLRVDGIESQIVDHTAIPPTYLDRRVVIL